MYCYWKINVLLLTVIVCVICALETPDRSDDDQDVSESSRELREFDPDKWRAVETHQEGASGWIPHNSNEYPKRRRLRKRKRRPQIIENESTEEFKTERPIRKRIRPQRLDEINEEQSWEEEMHNESPRRPYNRRRIIPNYNNNEPLINPVSASIRFEEESENNLTRGKINYEKVRDPFTALEEAEQKQKTNIPPLEEQQNKSKPEITAAPTDLKALLKQTTGGLSLSEILQQKNLTLSALLMGNQEAISALTEKPAGVEINTEQPIFNESTENNNNSSKYKRLPPSVGLKKNVINRNFEPLDQENSFEEISSRELLEAQRKRLALLHAHRENKIYTDVTKFDVVTESVTEKRIFVPSHPKYYTSMDYKPEFFEHQDETTKNPLETTTTTTVQPITELLFITTTMTPKKITEQSVIYSSSFKPFRTIIKANLPLTSAKLNKLHTHQDQNFVQTTSSLPPKAFKIDVNELLGLIKTEKSDEPFKMTFDLTPKRNRTEEKYQEENFVKPEAQEVVLLTEKSPPFELKTFTSSTTEFPKPPPVKVMVRPFKIKINASSEPTTTTTITTLRTTTTPVEKIKHITAKEEIMEILKDPLSKERLSRILATRNMTIQELVEQRERGSSQLHLADIFHNETKEPMPKDEPSVGQMNPEYFSNFPMMFGGRKQKSRTVFEPTKSNTAKTERPKDIYTVTSFPTYKIEMSKSAEETNQQQPFLPIWRQLYPTVFTGIYENNPPKTDLELNHHHHHQQISENEYQEELGRFDEIENKLTDINNDRLNSIGDRLDFDEEDEVFINLPSGVKSAIIASLAIIGLSLIVFLTILVIFKYSQRHKKRLNYSNSFSGSKIKSPILQSHHKRSFRDIMNETLGRKTNYYKSHLQSMSDNIWENDNKKQPF